VEIDHVLVDLVRLGPGGGGIVQVNQFFHRRFLSHGNHRCFRQLPNYSAFTYLAVIYTEWPACQLALPPGAAL
ncbi:MAG: hypothetical protein KAU17_14300, partial [Spirochaetales bacterium]|nr:hypothetical protein [Spirochaetales bacterium]